MQTGRLRPIQRLAPKLASSPPKAMAVSVLASMKNGLVYLRPQRIVFIRETGPYDRSIPVAWEKMFRWLSKNQLSSPVGRGYGLACDDPAVVAAAQCRYDACVQLTPLFEERALRELAVKTLPGGPYLRSRFVGDYADVSKLVGSARSSAELPEDLRADVRRPLVTIYLDDPSQPPAGGLRADICVPISAASGRDSARAA
jgi:AraC family transcriptional regulator